MWKVTYEVLVQGVQKSIFLFSFQSCFHFIN